MTVELNKDDLITLVNGLEAPNELMTKYKKLGIGSYTGGFVDEWRWDKYGLKELSEKYKPGFKRVAGGKRIKNIISKREEIEEEAGSNARGGGGGGSSLLMQTKEEKLEKIRRQYRQSAVGKARKQEGAELSRAMKLGERIADELAAEERGKKM
jgi:hypothetical protein